MMLKENYNCKKITLFISIIFLYATLAYSQNILSLRVPIEEDSMRREQIIDAISPDNKRREIKRRLDFLKTIREKDEITGHDEKQLIEMGDYYNIPCQEDFMQDRLEYVEMYHILSSVELASLDDNSDFPVFSIDIMEGTATLSFSHTIAAIHDDEITLMALVEEMSRQSDDPGRITIKTIRNLTYVELRSLKLTTRAWLKILQGFKNSNISSDTKIILELIDALREHILEVQKLKVVLQEFIKGKCEEYNNKNTRLTGLLERFLRKTKVAQNKCYLKRDELHFFRDLILLGWVNQWEDINKSINSTLDGIEGVEIELDFERDLAPIYANPLKMSYLWHNLIINSLDAIDEAIEEGKIKKGRIAIKTHAISEDKEVIEVIFTDNGIGIPNWLLAKRRLFEPGRTSKQRGTGLGLYIIDRIMAPYGGFVEVKNNKEGGAEFVLRFPITPITTEQKRKLEILKDLKLAEIRYQL